MNLSGPIQITDKDLYSSSATAAFKFGQEAVDRYGNHYRYCLAGSGAALVAGNVIQAAAELANHQAMAPSAAAIGDLAITVTPGATAGAAGLYSDGFAFITVTPGLGQRLAVKRHAAITASVAFTFYLYEDDPLRVALTTSSRVDLIANPFKNVIQAPVTTLTGAVVGVAVYPIPASEYGWVQTKGIAAVLTKGTPGPGVAVVSPGSAAGAVVVDGAAAATLVVGAMMETGVDGATNAVALNLP